jgi:hypothetical protein
MRRLTILARDARTIDRGLYESIARPKLSSNGSDFFSVALTSPRSKSEKNSNEPEAEGLATNLQCG